MDIREKLQISIYTDTDKNVCQWMVLNLDKAAEFSLRQMADAAYTSAPTVLRVIQKIRKAAVREYPPVHRRGRNWSTGTRRKAETGWRNLAWNGG